MPDIQGAPNVLIGGLSGLPLQNQQIQFGRYADMQDQLSNLYNENGVLLGRTASDGWTLEGNMTKPNENWLGTTNTVYYNAATILENQ